MRLILHILLFLFSTIAFGQSITSTGQLRFKIDDGLEVALFPQLDCENCFYYLPCNLQLSFKNKKPEISMVQWDQSGDQQAGAILHLLINWGLSNQQQEVLKQRIEAKIEGNAVIVGPVSVQGIKQDVCFFGDEKFSNFLNKHLTNLPLSPTTPGSKMAFSFRFKGDEVAKLNSYIEDKQKHETYIALKYQYSILESNGRINISDHEVNLSMNDVLSHIRN